MRTLSYFIFAAVLGAFTACSESDTKQPEQTQAAPSATPGNAAPGQSQLPVQMPSAAEPAAATGAVNPAHGEPGHRCDIAVGAPLNSAPSAPSAANPQVTAAPQPTITQPTIQQTPAPSAGTGKVNPAHGEPGHDCTIAVGAPLKQGVGDRSG